MDSLFFSYSHKDEPLLDQLHTHLNLLIRKGVISIWHDRRLLAGDPVDNGIDDQLEKADIILLLVSPDFLASDYCYGREMTRALDRHKAGEARVIPVILRPCDWKDAPFGKLLPAPKDGTPVTKWADRDEAFLDITSAIRNAVGKRDSRARPSAVPNEGPGSGNLRSSKTFSERDHERFASDAYEFIGRFFESSLDELSAHDSGMEVVFSRIDVTRFTASVGRGGVPLGCCVVCLDRLGSVHEVTFFRGTEASSNGYLERLLVEAGEDALVLKATRNAMFRGAMRQKTFTPEAAAEYYWQLFVAPMFEDMSLSSAGAPDRIDFAPPASVQTASAGTSGAAGDKSPENFTRGADVASPRPGLLQAQTAKPLAPPPTDAPQLAQAPAVTATHHEPAERVLSNEKSPASEKWIATPATAKDDIQLKGAERVDEKPSTEAKSVEAFSVITDRRPSVSTEDSAMDSVPEVSPQVELDHGPCTKAETAAALYNFGMRHELGLGRPPDMAKAREYYIRAARKGQRGAMNSLGLLYEQGEGVIAPNLEKARVWFRLAARHNSEEARENLRRFEN
jgi:hypothetical protein